MSTAAAVVTPGLTLESLLGGRGVLQAMPRTALDWVAVIRRGISSAAVDSPSQALCVTQLNRCGRAM